MRPGCPFDLFAISRSISLESVGAHVTFGVRGLKTHGKTALVVRKEAGGLRCYAHIGTGNYHVKTARLYADFGLLTCNPACRARPRG